MYMCNCTCACHVLIYKDGVFLLTFQPSSNATEEQVKDTKEKQVSRKEVRRNTNLTNCYEDFILCLSSNYNIVLSAESATS